VRLRFTLDERAVTSCPVDIQNSFLSALASLKTAPAPAADEHDLVALLQLHHPAQVTDLRRVPKAQQVEACLTAMRDGQRLIVGGQLPPDRDNHRRGQADLLIRATAPTGSAQAAPVSGQTDSRRVEASVGESGDPPQGQDLLDQGDGPTRQFVYYPVLLRHHDVFAGDVPGDQPQLQGRLVQPYLAQATPASGQFLVEANRDELLILAHLWHLIFAAGFAGEKPMGGIVGTHHQRHQRDWALAWVDLSAPLMKVHTAHRPDRQHFVSAINRYRHEFRFRVDTAIRAAEHDQNPELALRAKPVRIPACESCPWWVVCGPQLSDDLSVTITQSHLDTREVLALRGMGISSTADLAAAEVDQLLGDYLPQVSHRVGTEERLRSAFHRSQLKVQGVALERLRPGQIELPATDVEIDLDLEMDAAGAVYLWGMLLTDHRLARPPQYQSFSAFAPIDGNTEQTLARGAVDWLEGYVATLPEGVSWSVWHYSDSETRAIQRIAKARGHPPSAAMNWLLSRLGDHIVDLLPFVQRNFFGVDGLGLKAVATAGPGYVWRDQSLSGTGSQSVFVESYQGESWDQRQQARQRILDYNEDDVRATAGIRTWLRSLR
jgi:predicted RecB family nuclease